MTLGYVEITLAADTLLGAAASVARGHRVHVSTLSSVPDSVERVYQGADGDLIGRTLMSDAHLHFASNPELARGFVDACVAARS
jgi:cobyrinic acid a,c-diamide synthase